MDALFWRNARLHSSVYMWHLPRLPCDAPSLKQVMALEHKTLPISAVQFHPESILTNPSYGLTILSNCLNCLSYNKNT